MPRQNKVLMSEARKSLQGRWGIAVAISAIFMAISIGASSIPGAGWIASLIISGPLIVGLNKIFLEISRGRQVELDILFDGFSIFSTSLISYLLILLYVILWTLLLIVPGIIAMISYSMTYFIISEQVNIKPADALRKSKMMMQGNKMQFFLLCCRFIGWFIVGILSAGIGFLWIIPYFMTSMAHFYDDVKQKEQIQTTN